MTIPRTPEQFSALLPALGIPAALAYLNAGVPHRYTAIYQLDGDKFRNIHLHDKRGEIVPAFLAVVPMADSFCQFVLRDGVFATQDSNADRRLDGHKYQGAVLAYHGVPIADETSKLWGTLCHFDVATHALPDLEFLLLQQAAGVLLPALRHDASPALPRG